MRARRVLCFVASILDRGLEVYDPSNVGSTRTNLVEKNSFQKTLTTPLTRTDQGVESLRRLYVLLIAAVVVVTATYLWWASKPVFNPPVVEPTIEPKLVSLGVITYDPVIDGHFNYIANLTIAEVNEYAESKDNPYRFDYVKRKTSGIEEALHGVIDMRLHGVKIFLGFDESEAMCASLSYAMINHIILMGVPLIHHESSAIAGDEMFRVAPNLRQSIHVFIDSIRRLGFSKILIIQKAGGWGDTVGSMLTDIIGEDRVVYVRYEAEGVNSTLTLDITRDRLSALESRWGVLDTAVVFTGGEELGQLMYEAESTPGIKSLPWLVLQESSDPYKVEAGLPDTPLIHILAGVYTIKMEPILSNRFFEELRSGYASTNASSGDGLTLIDASFRDSIWIAALSVMEANSTDAEVIKGIIPDVARGYFGATGQILLDANGDRAVGYGVYQLKTAGWEKIGEYTPENDSVTLLG